MNARRVKKEILWVIVNRKLFVGLIFAVLFFFMGTFCICRADAHVLSQKEQEYVRGQDILKVGYVDGRKPVSFQDEKSGELAGVSRMIFDRIMELTGLKFEYVALPEGDVTYNYLREQQFDLITSVEYNNANKNSNGILMSEPYLSTKKVIIGNSELDFDLNKHLKIALSTGSQTIKKVLKEQYPHFEIVDYDSIEECFEAVRDGGGADLLILNQYVAEYWMSKPRYEDMKIIPMLGLDDMLCFSSVVPLNQEIDESEENREEWERKNILIGILDKAISWISEDEVAAYLIESTMSYQYQYDFSDFLYRYRYHIAVLITAGVVICILIFVAVFFYIRSMKAQAESRAKGKFLSAMSHEMRTPLNGLLGMHYIMSQNLKDEEKMSDALQQAAVMTRYLLSLVNDILEMSELQENKIILENRPFSLHVMMEALESMEKRRMEEKGIEFSVEGNLPFPDLCGDEKRVEQVLLKLTDNAWKYTSRGGKVTVRADQRRTDDGRISTRICVEDTGCGMSKEFQQRIFDSFTQERTTVSKGNEGTGLGMSISYRLAKLMDGDLKVRSEPGRGSSFTFLFLAPQAEKSEEQRESPAEKEEIPVKKKILVAEDNELNAEILMELLTTGGYEVVHAFNGQEAVDIFAASAPGEFSVILMDLMMPEKSGFEAAREIRNLKRQDAGRVRIFACTANTMKEDKKKAYECGMDDFISKPVDMNVLFQKLG